MSECVCVCVCVRERLCVCLFVYFDKRKKFSIYNKKCMRLSVTTSSCQETDTKKEIERDGDTSIYTGTYHISVVRYFAEHVTWYTVPEIIARLIYPRIDPRSHCPDFLHCSHFFICFLLQSVLLFMWSQVSNYVVVAGFDQMRHAAEIVEREEEG